MKRINLCKCRERLELMEKEILSLKGREREKAKREYLELLKACDEVCGLEDPIYYMRI